MSVQDSIKIFDSFGAPRLELDRKAYLQEQVKGRTVLHVGCADYPITRERLDTGSLLHENLMEYAASLTGVDLSDEGLAILREHGISNLLQADAEQLALDETFDIILAGDVVEHMNNPGLFMERARDLLAPGGQLIIGVPNAFTFNIIRLFLGQAEPTHKDHTFYFSPKTLAELGRRHGFAPTRLVFTVLPPDRYDSTRYIWLRERAVKLFPKLAPSMIVHFQRVEEAPDESYYEWK